MQPLLGTRASRAKRIKEYWNRRFVVMSAKKIFIATAVALSALAGTVGAANAGHRHNGFHGHHGQHGLRLHVGPAYRDCSFYREMWEETGRLKWKRRYYECKGWW